MQKGITLFIKGLSFAFNLVLLKLQKVWTFFLLYTNNVNFQDFKTTGTPYIMVARGARCDLGKGLHLNNTTASNPIGRQQRCMIIVHKGANVKIGDNVGLSAVALVAQESITIEDNVKIGGNVCIYDTDFHSIRAKDRINNLKDLANKMSKPVIVKENAFIGAHSTILKGVTIGRNSIIGACSVVTKCVPDNEVWGGNPAHFLKAIKHDE